MMEGSLGPGRPEPLGVTHDGRGVDVAIASAHAEAIDFCVFDAEGAVELARWRLPSRTGDVFHGRIEGLPAGTRYGFRVHGPWAPAKGHRFNPAKLLVDPHAGRLDRPFQLHPSLFDARIHGAEADEVDSALHVPKGIVEAPSALVPPLRPRIAARDRIVYEMHVKGFTKLHPDVPEAIRGTFAGLAHPAAIAHLTRLGVNVVELLPIWAGIDERHLGPLGLTNYWGYNPVSFFAPDPRLAPGGWEEVRAAVDALHDAGIAVILDVVLNHTGESDHLGPTVSLRGLDNALYYRLRADDPSRYVDDAGCGNVPALDRPAPMRLGLDALRNAVARSGFDGFRYDLATTLGRRAGGFDPMAPFLAALAQDPLLRDLIHIAEPWDIGPGGYHLGAFPSTWGEWNDRFRDCMRRFWRGDEGLIGEVATRLAGSSDVFGPRRRAASDSVNFVTAHDGFTLADLVSHAHKHNEANGEHNRDGTDANNSWNHGVEGATSDPKIVAARARDVRALLATLLTARGTPMLSMGDEVGRTQQGNNNAYAQDNAISWFDWAGMDEALVDFTSRLIRLRAAHPALRDERPPSGATIGDSGLPDVLWLRMDGRPFEHHDWHDGETFRIAAVFAGPDEEGAVDRVAVVLSADPRATFFVPPPPRPGMRWVVRLDTAHPDRTEQLGQKFAIDGRSVTILVEEPEPGEVRSRPADHGSLDRLARAAGIAPEWWDVTGKCTRVGDEAKRAILKSMGLSADTLGEAQDSLDRLLSRTLRRALPLAHTVFAGAPAKIPLVDDGTRAGRSTALVIELADGSRRRLTVQPGDGTPDNVTTADERVVARRLITLPDLPIGRHRVHLEGSDVVSLLTVAPRSCWLPEDLAGGARRFGIASHLYTLRRDGDQGIGDFTTLGQVGARAGRAGAVTLGINPIHALFPEDRERASPYSPSDRRFLDPIFIDVSALPEQLANGLGFEAARVALDGLRLAPLVHIDYPEVWRVKQGALRAAFTAFEALRANRPDDPLVAEFEAFVRAGGPGLARFATFEAICSVTGNLNATGFPLELATAEAPGVADFARRHERAVRFSMMLQWLAMRQLAQADATARAAGLTLGFYRDLAVGCAPDGAEVWGAGDLLMRRVSVGAPPDPLGPQGQVWSLPPPNPVAMAAAGFAPFAELIRANMAHAGALRIDHVLGLRRLFVVPDGMSGAEGAYVDQPFEDLLGQLALESHAAKCVVVGEDLGTVPWGFKERMAEAKVLSYQVVWFEREGEGFRPPEHYPPLGAACVATHDLPTLAGWWLGLDLMENLALGRLSVEDFARDSVARDREKRILIDTLVAHGDLAPVDEAVGLPNELTPEIAAAIHAYVSAGASMLALVQADDLSAETERLNLPGTDRERKNWRRRLLKGTNELFEDEMGSAILAAFAKGRVAEG